jgi:DnaJ domain
MAADRRSRSEERDYYAVLGAEPSASAAELRGAFRDAVLRHHPDRAPASDVATRRTSLLNRAWSELRDPVRRIHYDRSLERGHAATVDWPLEEGEAPSAPPPRRRRQRVAPLEPSPWHQPQWRSVAGFRVPAEVFLAGPAAQRRWIVEHHIRGEDWRTHDERYWLRFAAHHYREHGRTEDALGALERLVELEPTFDGIVQASLRDAFAEAGQELRGASLLRRAGERFAADGPQRLWAERELRALLGDFRERRVARGRPAARAENGELLLNFMESLALEPSFSDVRAAIVAHRRAGNIARAAELVDRIAAQPVTEAGRWFSLVQLLTEAGELDRASTLLAEIARGEHPEALDARQVSGQPWKRIAAARTRLARARRRIGRSSDAARREAAGQAVGA